MAQAASYLPTTRTTRASDSHAGDTTMTLATGGAVIAPNPSPGTPAVLALVTTATLGLPVPTMTVFACTGRTGDQLTGVSAISGQDQYYPAGSYAYEAINPATGAGTGTVASVGTGTGLTGGPITTS